MSKPLSLGVKARYFTFLAPDRHDNLGGSTCLKLYPMAAKNNAANEYGLRYFIVEGYSLGTVIPV
jgi:hypothetical protein